MTVNGFGTLYYGWKNLPDGTSLATNWVVVAFFPLIPLSRARIQVHPTSVDGTGRFIYASGFHANWTVLEYLPLDWLTILSTYLWAYLVVPVVIGVPIAGVIFGLIRWFGSPDLVPVKVYFSHGLGSMTYAGIVVAYILDGAAGRRSVPREQAIPIGSDEWLAKYIGTHRPYEQGAILVLTPIVISAAIMWYGAFPQKWAIAVLVLTGIAIAAIAGAIARRAPGGIRFALFWFDVVLVPIFIVMAPVMFMDNRLP